MIPLLVALACLPPQNLQLAMRADSDGYYSFLARWSDDSLSDARPWLVTWVVPGYREIQSSALAPYAVVTVPVEAGARVQVRVQAACNPSPRMAEIVTQ